MLISILKTKLILLGLFQQPSTTKFIKRVDERCEVIFSILLAGRKESLGTSVGAISKALIVMLFVF
jgi:hypothetical protein